MRLTKKDTNYIGLNGKSLTKYSIKKGLTSILDLEEMNNLYGNTIQKLGQLEDIEEELGVDLITLFKALKNGIWIKKQSQTKYPLVLLRRHYSNGKTKYYVFDGKAKVIKLKDYGKTWALTKEELL